MPVLSLNSIRHTRPRGPHAAHTRPVLTAPPPGLPSVFHRGVEKWYLVRLITWRSRVRLPPPQPRGPLPKAAALAISRVVASRKAGAGVDPRPGGEIGDASAAKRRRKRGHMTPLHERRRGSAVGNELGAPRRILPNLRATRPYSPRSKAPPEGGAQEPTVRSSRKNQSSKALQGVRYAGLAVRVIAGPCVCEMQGGKRR